MLASHSLVSDSSHFPDRKLCTDHTWDLLYETMIWAKSSLLTPTIPVSSHLLWLLLCIRNFDWHNCSTNNQRRQYYTKTQCTRHCAYVWDTNKYSTGSRGWGLNTTFLVLLPPPPGYTYHSPTILWQRPLWMTTIALLERRRRNRSKSQSLRMTMSRPMRDQNEV